MKKILLLLFFAPLLAFGAANQVIVSQYNSTGTAITQRIFDTGNNSLLGTNASGTPSLVAVSTGLTLSSGSLVNSGVTSATGTTGQIDVSASTGGVTFSLPTAVTGVNSVTAQSTSNLTFNAGSSGNRSILLNSTGIGVVSVTRASANAELNVTATTSGIGIVAINGVSSSTSAASNSAGNSNVNLQTSDTTVNNFNSIQSANQGGFTNNKIVFRNVSNADRAGQMEFYTRANSGVLTLGATLGTDQVWVFAQPLPVASGGTGRTTVATPTSTYAAGTAYSLTNTAAALDFGTTDPSITIPTTGTYVIRGAVNLLYNAATFAANQTVTLKFRRTNNTAADLSNGTMAVTTQIITTLTYTYGVFRLPEITYSATAGDIITIFADVSVVPGAGSLDAVASGTFIMADPK